MPKTTKEREPGFEESLSALEKIVAQLESGDLPLERALKLFEEGVGLARQCQSQLEEAERKVEILLRERGEVKAIPFEVNKNNQVDEIEKSTQHSTANPTAAGMTGQDQSSEEEAKLNDSIPF